MTDLIVKCRPFLKLSASDCGQNQTRAAQTKRQAFLDSPPKGSWSASGFVLMTRNISTKMDSVATRTARRSAIPYRMARPAGIMAIPSQ